MKVDLSKLDQIIIQDNDRNVVDRFTLGSASLEKGKLTGRTLFLQKR